ncbi:MAG: methylated-DNA--[protein]-cysteine S-methyltransferase [Actinomycetota bacterium]
MGVRKWRAAVGVEAYVGDARRVAPHNVRSTYRFSVVIQLGKDPDMSVQSRIQQGSVAGGAAIRYGVGESSLGCVLVARSERGVCALLLGDDPEELTRDLERRFPGAAAIEDLEALAAVVAQAIALVEAPKCGLDVALDLGGTEFQRRVWRALSEIPAGATATYTDIANRIEQPKAVRAVAQACAANALAVVIPCHRVVRSDGGLSGYRWGVERKRSLLEREAAA